MPFEDMQNLSADEKYDKLGSVIPNLIRAGKNNDEIKRMRSALRGKEDDSLAVIEGISIVEAAAHSDIIIHTLALCPDEIYTERAQKCLLDAAQKANQVLAVSPSVFSYVSQKKNSNGIAALIELKYKKISEIAPSGINIVLDSLELPGNIGTIMRSADASGLSSVVVTNTKAKLNNPTLLAASRGAFAGLNIVVDTVDNISNWAKKNDVRIFLADTRAEKVHTEVNLNGKVCFVLGCERYGIDEKWYKKEHELLKIPMLGNCDSLNVGVAGSVLLYEALRQQK